MKCDLKVVFVIGYFIRSVICTAESVCKNECRNDCPFTEIINSEIACHVTYINNSVAVSYKKTTDVEETEGLLKPSKIITSGTKKIHCGIVSKKILKGPKKKGSECKIICNVKAQDGRSNCLLHKQENISFGFSSENILIKLPLSVKPGMKLTVYGANVKGLSSSQLTTTKDSEDPSNPLKWLHILPYWKRKTVFVTEGIDIQSYSGDFPISDPSHFTLELELTPSSTKIYADKILLKSSSSIKEIKEFYIHRYSMIYLVMIQKTGKECEDVDIAVP